MTQKRNSVYNETLVAVLLGLVATVLALLGSVSLNLRIPEIEIAISFICGSVVFALVKRSSKELLTDKPASRLLVKVLALSVLSMLAISIGAAIRSFWFSPLADDYGNRFAFENLSVAASFGAVLFMAMLSFLQKDLFWVSRKKSALLDERQIKERQDVFEKSYKIGVVTLLLLLWFSSSTAHNIPAIMANHHGTVPGHFQFIFINVVTFFVSLPLLIGAFKDTPRRK